MLHASLHSPDTYGTILKKHPVWTPCLEWLKTLTPETPLGRYDLERDLIFGMVQAYTTLPRDQCRFESHREYVDLQYTIQGEEIIDWIDRDSLSPEGIFENDVQFWKPPVGTCIALLQTPGWFAIFHPEDAHRPKVMARNPAVVKKVVIKVNSQFFKNCDLVARLSLNRACQ